VPGKLVDRLVALAGEQDVAAQVEEAGSSSPRQGFIGGSGRGERPRRRSAKTAGPRVLRIFERQCAGWGMKK
jgi:hypothetical protein